MENKILDSVIEMAEKEIKSYESKISRLSSKINGDEGISEYAISCASGMIRSYEEIINSLRKILKIACKNNTNNIDNHIEYNFVGWR